MNPTSSYRRMSQNERAPGGEGGYRPLGEAVLTLSGYPDTPFIAFMFIASVQFACRLASFCGCWP
ncbi:MAG: hypothetical protein NVV70_03740 [Cellulomonas sp.]|nr:hypothetical protein [Cellulomonas sp.]MCR6647280.1 hypothetical protein [Cellulomonas sp.]